jgi:hypothetical protein
MADDKKYVIVKVRNLMHWVEVVQELQQYSENIVKTGRFCEFASPWIYWGQANAKWVLCSSFERAVGSERWCSEHHDSLKKVEDMSIGLFKTRAHSMGLDNQVDDVDWLAQMQHYGSPTRLADFTEVPFVALYNAVYEENGNFAIYAIARNYVLGVEYWKDPYQDEAEKISDHCEDLHYDLSNSRKIANWIINPRKNPEPEDDTNAKILCVYPNFSNRRLEAQSGLFLMQRNLGGSFERDLESVLECQKCESSMSEFKRNLRQEEYCRSLRMIRFEFSKRLRDDAKVLLHAAGVTHKSIYPDFEGLAKYVKEMSFVADNDGRLVHEDCSSRSKVKLQMHLPEIKAKGGH